MNRMLTHVLYQAIFSGLRSSACDVLNLHAFEIDLQTTTAQQLTELTAELKNPHSIIKTEAVFQRKIRTTIILKDSDNHI